MNIPPIVLDVVAVILVIGCIIQLCRLASVRQQVIDILKQDLATVNTEVSKQVGDVIATDLKQANDQIVNTATQGLLQEIKTIGGTGTKTQEPTLVVTPDKKVN